MSELSLQRMGGGGINKFVHGATQSSSSTQDYYIRFPVGWTWAYMVFVLNATSPPRYFLAKVAIPTTTDGVWHSVEFIQKDSAFTSFSITSDGTTNEGFRNFKFICNLTIGYISYDFYCFQL